VVIENELRVAGFGLLVAAAYAKATPCQGGPVFAKASPCQEERYA